MAKTSKAMESTKTLMGALLRRPPKHHDEMKVGKRKANSAKKASPKRKIR